ncbi:MAG TPA: phage tail protein [Erwiniaceae bacterium]|nr:phage tail protein [Erwiniaceae bacterium]
MGEAAKRNVGTGVNQIPDMGSWSGSAGESAWRRSPDGTIIQRGRSHSGPIGAPETVKLPIAFTSSLYTVIAVYDYALAGTNSNFYFATRPVSESAFALMSNAGSSGSALAYWIAIGN